MRELGSAVVGLSVASLVLLSAGALGAAAAPSDLEPVGRDPALRSSPTEQLQQLASKGLRVPNNFTISPPVTNPNLGRVAPTPIRPAQPAVGPLPGTGNAALPPPIAPGVRQPNLAPPPGVATPAPLPQTPVALPPPQRFGTTPGTVLPPGQSNVGNLPPAPQRFGTTPGTVLPPGQSNRLALPAPRVDPGATVQRPPVVYGRLLPDRVNYGALPDRAVGSAPRTQSGLSRQLDQRLNASGQRRTPRTDVINDDVLAAQARMRTQQGMQRILVQPTVPGFVGNVRPIGAPARTGLQVPGGGPPLPRDLAGPQPRLDAAIRQLDATPVDQRQLRQFSDPLGARVNQLDALPLDQRLPLQFNRQ